jgi:hypothetical protein
MAESADEVDTIRATIILCDFVNADASGKLNIVGGGIRLMGLDPNSGLTPPFGLAAVLESSIPLDDPPAVELVLTTATGQVMTLPGPNGKNQALRIAQNLEFVQPAVPGVKIPRGALPSTAQIAANFPTGLPLKAGFSYQWRIQVDHDVIASYSFLIPAPASGPVIG